MAKMRPATPQALPLIRSLGNLICVSDAFTVALGRDADFLPSIFHCLESTSRCVHRDGGRREGPESVLIGERAPLERTCPRAVHAVRPVLKETLWALSNFTAAPPDHVSLVEKSGVLRLVMMIYLGQTFDIRKEAMYVVLHVAMNGPQHLGLLLEHGLAKGPRTRTRETSARARA